MTSSEKRQFATPAHMTPFSEVTRRQFLSRIGAGVGGMAFASLLGEKAMATQESPHHVPRTKSVIYLHMAGSPPHHDLLDPKPVLEKWDGAKCPDHLLDPEKFAFIKGHPTVLPSPYSFAAHGESGMEISELMPHLATCADDICLIRSMHTDQFNHAPAQLFLYTGSPRLGRPSMGAWATWGLGSENENLPGYIVLVSGGKVPSAGKSVWGSGFLPSVHQGVQCRSSGDPILYVSDPSGLPRELRRESLNALARLNELQCEKMGDPEILSRVAQYELAFRMQMSVPEATDLAQESSATLEQYGAEPGGSSFANNCLLARRLVERGVRFVQLFDWGWDTHGTAPHDDIITQLPKKCAQTDRPVAALLKDLKQRGLLEDTLVIWSGEFGRTAMNEKRNGSTYLGRDHHPHCFSLWMAGGGAKGGYVHGETCDFGAEIVRDPVGIHDLQATIMHMMGFDHEQLTYHFQGRDYRLTDVHGEVVPALLG